MSNTPKIEASVGLVFITSLGPPNIKNKTTQTQIRKHVMRDIGKSRRKVKKNAQVDLELTANTQNQNTSLVYRSKPGKRSDAAQQSSFLPSNQSSTPTAQQLCLDGADTQQQAWEPQDVFLNVGLFCELGSFDRLWTGRADPFIRYPFDIDQRTRELVDQVFDDRYVNVGPFRDACLPVGMTGEAAFLQVLSNALVNLSCGRAQSYSNHIEPLEAMKYHARAVKLVNSRISDPEYVVSDVFISTIIGFACYHSCTSAATIKGSESARQIHMNGIDQVLLLRGGLDTLNKNTHIRTLLGWSDIEGACIQDTLPRYPCPDFLPLPSAMPLAPPLSLQAQNIIRIWNKRYPEQTHLCEILIDLRRFLSYLASEAIHTRRKILCSAEFATWYLFPLMHRLCALALPIPASSPTPTSSQHPKPNSTGTYTPYPYANTESSPSPSSDQNSEEPNSTHTSQLMHQVFRLSLLLSLTELRRLFGINGIVSSLQTMLLQTYLTQLSQLSPSVWDGLSTLHMWCLAMGGIESVGVQRDWFAAELRRVAGEEGLGREEQVEREISEVVWLNDVHGPMWREVWRGENEIRYSGLPGVGRELGEWRYGGHRPVKDEGGSKEETEQCWVGVGEGDGASTLLRST